MAGYYRRFVKDFSKIATPLTQLLRKDHKFNWTEEGEASFQELKQKLVTAPILAIPEGNEGYVVYSDASRQGLGCVLVQNGRVVNFEDEILIRRGECKDLVRHMTSYKTTRNMSFSTKTVYYFFYLVNYLSYLTIL